MNTAKQKTIPAGYYSYYAALLAVETLIDKVADSCTCPPVMAGALAERKAAVRMIEIECLPDRYKENITGNLYPQPRNRVLDTLLPRYTDIIPEGKDHTVTKVEFTYMSIPTVIHFKNNETGIE